MERHAPADPYPAAHAAARSTPCPDCGGRLHVCHEGETARCDDCGEEFDVLSLAIGRTLIVREVADPGTGCEL